MHSSVSSGVSKSFSKRFASYAEVSLTRAITHLTVQTTIKVLGILAVATKETSQGSASQLIRQDISPHTEKYLKKFAEKAGQSDTRGGSDGHCAGSEKRHVT